MDEDDGVSLTWQYYFLDREDLVDRVVDFFTAKATNPALFNNIAAKCKGNPVSFASRPQHDTQLKLGYLSATDFLYYESSRAQQQGIPTVLVHRLLEQLCERAILIREPLLQSGREAVYTVNNGLAQYLYERQLIKCVIFGFDYIVDNYRNAVVKILVKTQEGNDGLGTGILFNISNHDASLARSIVITNKHVAYNQKHLQVMSVENEVKEWERIFVSDRYDIAAIELRDFWETPSFHFFEDAKVLNDIIIVGYPPVPTTRAAYQLVHRGEINAFVTDYWQNDFILFSAKTSPGNSGGPVINDMGMVVGVATQQLFEKGAFEGRGQLPYFAAIPSKSVVEFLNDQVVGQLVA